MRALCGSIGQFGMSVVETGGRPDVRFLGVFLAFLSFSLDQAVKMYLLDSLSLVDRGVMRLTPFLDLVFVENRGISYGIFADIAGANLMFAGLASSLILWLVFQLYRADAGVSAAGLGLVLGGAVGNVVDRIVHGAVVDFVSFHIGGFYWYVFNLADAAIVFGVMLLAWHFLSLRGEW